MWNMLKTLFRLPKNILSRGSNSPLPAGRGVAVSGCSGRCITTARVAASGGGGYCPDTWGDYKSDTAALRDSYKEEPES